MLTFPDQFEWGSYWSTRKLIKIFGKGDKAFETDFELPVQLRPKNF